MSAVHRRRRTCRAAAPVAALLTGLALHAGASLAGCAGGAVDVQSAERVELDLERRNAERVARYYLGGFAAADGGDPVAVGLLTVDDGDLWLHPQALPAPARAALQDDGDGIIDGDEFSAWAGATYRAARSLPASLDELRSGARWSESDTAWFAVSIEGSPMTHARRRLFVPREALRAAIRAFAAGDGLTYPPGTLLVGEHMVDGALIETTVKRKRGDGFWDFMVFDAAGRLADRTSTEPRALRAPAQCTGCHLGARLFEPDRSFPAAARPGPAGRRAIEVPDSWRDAGAAATFREHAARTDHVLGPYATIYLGRLRAELAAGRVLPPADRRILDLL